MSKDKSVNKHTGTSFDDMDKKLTVLQRFQAIQNIGTEVEVPWYVWRLFGSQQKSISISSDQISFGEDFASPQECRIALQWYVTQMGGKVKW